MMIKKTKNYVQEKTFKRFTRGFMVVDIPSANNYESWILQELKNKNIPFVSSGIMRRDGESIQLTFVEVKKKDVDTLIESASKISEVAILMGYKNYENEKDKMYQEMDIEPAHEFIFNEA